LYKKYQGTGRISQKLYRYCSGQYRHVEPKKIPAIANENCAGIAAGNTGRTIVQKIPGYWPNIAKTVPVLQWTILACSTQKIPAIAHENCASRQYQHPTQKHWAKYCKLAEYTKKCAGIAVR
jgi:hypothetical protein